SQITTRDHNAICRLEDFVEPVESPRALDLRDQERIVPQCPGSSAHGIHVCGAFHKRLTHCVHAILQCELQTFVIALSEGANAEIEARQIQSFARAQFTTDFH